MNAALFKKTVWEYYKKHKRHLPWRDTQDPYRILVSEVMLQQTQVSRILVKYPLFITEFPDFKRLGAAPIKDILRAWQGIGYNRRALYLKKIAKIVMNKYKGVLPENPAVLDSFPGIGKATAASICAFAFNKSVVFIETNIRRVFIHHFFKDKHAIDDKQIIPFVQKTLEAKNLREWYFALMDYGSYLGKLGDNPNRKSKQYTIQPSFEGSDRQIRGQILQMLLEKPLSNREIVLSLKKEKNRIEKIMKSLVQEQFILYKNGRYNITS